MKITFSVISALLLSFSLHATTISNIEIPDSVSFGDPSKKLVLNGAGIRSKFVFDIYRCALPGAKAKHRVCDIPLCRQ